MIDKEIIAMIIACASCIGKDTDEHGQAQNVFIDDDTNMISVSFEDDTTITYYATYDCGAYNLFREID